MENVRIPSHPQPQLAEDYISDSPKSYYSNRQEDTSALLENEESVSDNGMTEADFIQCAGQLGFLITHMTLMKQNMMKCTVTSPEAFLVDAKEVAQSCKKNSSKIGKSIESAHSKRDKEKVAILESDLPESVPSDPGLRPPNMTKSQIEYLAQIGPQQPKLFNYPQDKRSREITSKTVFVQPGIPSIYSWSTALKGTLFFVSSARCFLMVQIENGWNRIGVPLM